MPVNRTDRWLLAALLLLNLVLKCSWLGVNGLFNDEPFTVYWSQQPWSTLWPMLATENNPPLYFMLVKAWSAFTPFTAEWLRVPSAMFSALVVWPLFLLTHALAGRRAAMVSTLLFTFANYHYGFAHEVRAYALFTLLCTTSVWLLVRGRAVGARHTVLFLGAVNLLLVYTHFFGWLVVGIQFLLVHLLRELHTVRRSFWLAMVVVAMGYLPYAATFLHRLGQSVGQGTWLEAPTTEEVYNMLWRWSNQPVLVVLFLAVVLWACAKDRLRPLGLRAGLLWALVPLLGMFAISFAVPMFLDRYLVFAAPGFALLVGVAVDTVVPPGRVGRWLSCIPVLGMLATFAPWKAARNQPQRVVAQVEAWRAGACRLEVRPSWYQLNYAAAKDITLLKRAEPLLDPSAVYPTMVVVVDAGADLQDPQRQWRSALEAEYPSVDSVEADHRVWVYRFRH